MTKEQKIRAARRLIPAWQKELTAIRLQRCRAMLYLHGYLSDAENERVAARLAALGEHDEVMRPIARAVKAPAGPRRPSGRGGVARPRRA